MGWDAEGRKIAWSSWRTSINQKRRANLAIGALNCLIRHSWQNGYGEWNPLRLAFGRMS